MRKILTAVAALQMLAVTVQFFLAGSGAFDSAPRDEAFTAHSGLGSVILVIAVLTTVLAAVARVPGRLIGMSGAIVGLVVLQHVIAGVANAAEGAGGSTSASEMIFGLHAINGLAIVAVAGRVLRGSRRAAVTSGSGGSPADASVPAP